MLLTDFGPIAASLTDPRGLVETGEVLVGVATGQTIHLILPPRLESNITELTARDLPPLSAASNGNSDTSERSTIAARMCWWPFARGPEYPGWGLIAKIDSAEAYAPVRLLRGLLLALGAGALALGLGASNAIARVRAADPAAGQDFRGRRRRRPERAQRGRVDRRDRRAQHGVQHHDRGAGPLVRDTRGRILERTRELEAVRDLLDAFFRISTSRQDPDNIEKTYDSVLRFCAQLGYDLAMISLVDRDAGVIRAVRATGSMTGVIGGPCVSSMEMIFWPPSSAKIA